MPATLLGGHFLAVLAVAAGQLQHLDGILMDCNSDMQSCDSDEQLNTPLEELHALQLLQKEFKLQSGSAKTVPASSNAHVQLVVAKPGISAKVKTKKAENHTLELRLNSSFSMLGSTTSQVFHVAPNLSVLGLKRSASEACGIGAAFIVVTFLAYIMYSSWHDGLPQKPSPSSQQSLQDTRLPHVAHPHMSPPSGVSTYNSRLSLPPAKMPGGVGLASLGDVRTSHVPGGFGQVLQSRPFLPPICPSLILPHTQARFGICLDSLMHAADEQASDEQLDIIGNSGRKLLHATVHKSPLSKRSLALTSVGSGDEPRVKLLAPPRTGANRRSVDGAIDIMEIYGRGGVFYGTLEPAEGGGARLRCDGEIVMSLEIDRDLGMTASLMDGRLIGSGGKNIFEKPFEKPLEGKDMWKVEVKPNIDVVLVTACMLAAVLL